MPTPSTSADIVSHAVYTPDGKRAVVIKFNGPQGVGARHRRRGKVTYSKLDLPTGLWPYNVAVAPGGDIALTADNGNNGNSDGSVDTVSVIDLKANPDAGHRPRGGRRRPEGMAISPKGDIAVAVILAGSDNKPAYF